MSSSGFSKGDRVVVSGMLQSIHLNDKHGTVVMAPKSKTNHPDEIANMRYGVIVDGEKKPVAIKVSNLSLETTKQDTLDGQQRPFQVGDSVILQGLNTVKFNDQRGCIISGPDPSNEGRYSVRLEKGEKVLKIKPLNIRPHFKNTENHTTVLNRMDKFKQFMRDEVADDDIVAMTKRMISNLDAHGQTMLFGRPIEAIPDFMADIEREGGLPVAVDYTWARNYLNQSHEMVSSLPHIMESQLKDSDYEPEPEEVRNRLGGPHNHKFQWYYSGHVMGDIYNDEQDRVYKGSVRYN